MVGDGLAEIVGVAQRVLQKVSHRIAGGATALSRDIPALNLFPRLANALQPHWTMRDWAMDDLQKQMRADLDEIGRTHMPFGKFGPQHYPPSGVPIYDLPVEYLAWFANKAGFPKGRLGTLLRMVHQMKVDGSDIVFDTFR